jgi:hypothetical protein
MRCSGLMQKAKLLTLLLAAAANAPRAYLLLAALLLLLLLFILLFFLLLLLPLRTGLALCNHGAKQVVYCRHETAAMGTKQNSKETNKPDDLLLVRWSRA